MKKITHTCLLVLFMGLGGLVGCKKKDEAPSIPRAQLLAGTTNKQWKITAASASTTGFPAVNLFDASAGPNAVPACKQDDIFTFSVDKTYQTSEGATTCATASTDQGTWALSANDTQLTLTSTTGGGALPYSGVPIVIKSITATTLQGEAANIPYSFGGFSVTVTVNVTFTAL